MVEVAVGKEAPDFMLPDTDRKSRKLSEFRGKKLVLAFFPGAFTSVCTKEMCTFRDSIARLNELKAKSWESALMTPSLTRDSLRKIF